MRFGVRWADLAPLAAEDPWIPEGYRSGGEGRNRPFITAFYGSNISVFPRKSSIIAITLSLLFLTLLVSVLVSVGVRANRAKENQTRAVNMKNRQPTRWAVS